MSGASARVYIWLPEGIGHSGLKIKTAEGNQYHISWPNGETGGLFGREAWSRLGFAGLRDNRSRLPQLQRVIDEMPPLCVVELPVADPSLATPFGVNVRQIERFWKSLLALPPGERYPCSRGSSTRHQGNAVVVESLFVGGLWKYADPPENLINQDARTLLSWVETARARIDAMNQAHADRDGERLRQSRRVPCPPR